MKKIVIGSLALASMVLLSSCELPGQKTNIDVMPQEDSMMKQEDTMMEKGDVMEKMEKEDTMMKKEEVSDDAMMKKNGEYTAYSVATLDAALASGKKVALFFHASWCPTCKALDTTLKNTTIPGDIVVLKVDYDAEKDLKQKYGITSQHTVVALDAQANMIKKETGSRDIESIVSLF